MLQGELLLILGDGRMEVSGPLLDDVVQGRAIVVQEEAVDHSFVCTKLDSIR
jgi:hypothetical protein